MSTKITAIQLDNYQTRMFTDLARETSLQPDLCMSGVCVGVHAVLIQYNPGVPTAARKLSLCLCAKGCTMLVAAKCKGWGFFYVVLVCFVCFWLVGFCSCYTGNM